MKTDCKHKNKTVIYKDGKEVGWECLQCGKVVIDKKKVKECSA